MMPRCLLRLINYWYVSVHTVRTTVTYTIIHPSPPSHPPSSFQGVNLDSASLLSNLDLVSKVTDKNLVLFTWGEKNDTPEVIELQKKRGVAAVIYDR